jgi:hypothetical protein
LLLAGTITAEGFHRFLTIDISVRMLMKWRPLCKLESRFDPAERPEDCGALTKIRLDKVVAVLIP